MTLKVCLHLKIRLSTEETSGWDAADMQEIYSMTVPLAT